ncbi:MAG: TIGR04084 family radical SAM/SPASM domain-containing protein [Candidatus Lokiarchaeota archaeon]|nr:TIGR04084 family radical SAM/SPASM domain-containing protein [Candidatus Lokiarchaeota archaeon]
MLFNIVTTHDCNLGHCRYCRNNEADPPFPRRISYDIGTLKRFVAGDPDAMIGFYGGEPLVGMDFVERIMDEIPSRKFVLQTNGILLDKVKDRYLHGLDCILLSIDGPVATTDYYRGAGTHDKVVKNARLLRRKGFAGEVTARMCVSEHSDVYRDATYLLGLEDDAGKRLFDGLHWQNDLMFGDREEWNDLDGWLTSSYYPGVDRLLSDWLGGIERDRTVRLIYPFNGLVKTLLSGVPAKLHCGCGHQYFNICTDGRITACPIASDFYHIFQMGTIQESTPDDLKKAMDVVEPCPSCDIYSICGGRCLYANKLKPWGEDGYAKVCESVRHLVTAVQAVLPRIQALIASGELAPSQFDYFRYNGAEIIP